MDKNGHGHIVPGTRRPEGNCPGEGAAVNGKDETRCGEPRATSGSQARGQTTSEEVSRGRTEGERACTERKL